MYQHRTYKEQSDDFDRMCLLVSHLNGLHLCDWSLGRLFEWKYGRWSKESQNDSLFEKQAELFFDGDDELCGIIITENFGDNFYILSKKDGDLIQSMVAFLLQDDNSPKSCVITVPVNDECQKEILERNGFAYSGDADVTYTYLFSDIAQPNITIPNAGIWIWLCHHRLGKRSGNVLPQNSWSGIHQGRKSGKKCLFESDFYVEGEMRK